MHTIEEYNALGAELEQHLYLKFAPIAVKLLYSRDEIPEGCYVPSRDKNEHPALCQAFAQVRRNKRSMAMFREDHWCVWPIVSFKLGEMTEEDLDYMGTKLFIRDPDAGRKYFREHFPVINSEREVPGIALAPLSSCTFEPDVIVVYCFPAQLRQMLMAAKYNTAQVVSSSLDTVGSCVHAIIPVLNGEKDYNLSIPDPGEYERSLADENEMIFTMKAEKLDEVLDGIRTINKMGFGYKQLALDMNLDYPRAEFYNVMFKKWGLETGEQWTDFER